MFRRSLHIRGWTTTQDSDVESSDARTNYSGTTTCIHFGEHIRFERTALGCSRDARQDPDHLGVEGYNRKYVKVERYWSELSRYRETLAWIVPGSWRTFQATPKSVKSREILQWFITRVEDPGLDYPKVLERVWNNSGSFGTCFELFGGGEDSVRTSSEVASS